MAGGRRGQGGWQDRAGVQGGELGRAGCREGAWEGWWQGREGRKERAGARAGQNGSMVEWGANLGKR